MPAEGVFSLDRSVHWRHIAGNEEEKKRQEAILELIVTEANYYQRLTVIHEVFFGKSLQILGEKERKKIFQNLEELLLRSGLLLSAFRDLQAKHKGVIPSVCTTFMGHMKHFDCFRTYCIGHQEASRTLHRMLDMSSRFSKSVRDAVDDPRCCNLDLASFLLEPVQRLARYPLLFKQILHYTPKQHIDHYEVLNVVSESEKYLASVNEAVREHESYLRLSHIQSNMLLMLDGDDEDNLGLELVGRTRKNIPRSIVLETPLWKCKSKRKLIGLILTDLLLLLEEKSGKYLLYRPPFALDEVCLCDVDFVASKIKLASGLQRDCAFEIRKSSESVLVASEHILDRQRWFQDLESAKQALQRPDGHLPTLDLPCMGTVLITMLSGTDICCTQASYCTLQLNNQRVDLKPALGKCPRWDQSVVLSMASFDDRLAISVFEYQKFAPSKLIGTAELSLDVLEYYDHRSTDRMVLNLFGGGQVSLILQYHSL